MNKVNPYKPTQRRTTSILLAKAALLVAALVLGDPTRALAEVKVEGRLDAVRLETAGSSVEQVLAALGATYGLRYRTAIALDRTLTGVYQGPLERVLARVLDSYDFVTKSSSGAVEVVILAERGGHPAARTAATQGVPLPPPPPPPAAMVPAPAGPVPAPAAAPPPSGEAQLELLRRSLEALRR
jgi:hypothetical protein